jgi:chromosome segregation ATPase
VARQGIDVEQILQAIRELENAGAEVTVTAVREKLGTGSFSTISKVLQDWRAQKSKAARPPVPETPEMVSGLFKQLWAEAWRAADALAEAERQAAAKERAEHEQAMGEMRAEISRLEKAFGELQGEHDRIAGENATKESERQALRIQTAEQQASLALLQGEGKQLRDEIKRANETAQKASESLTSWVERATRAEATQQAAAKERAQHEQEMSRLQGALRNLQSERDRLVGEAAAKERLEKEVKQLREETQKSSDSLASWIERATRAETLLEKQKQDNKKKEGK